MKAVFTNFKSEKLILMTIFLFLFIPVKNTDSQTWCTPNITQTFSQGISHVHLNGTPVLDRVSARNENYINTGMSTTLVRGQSYTISISQGFGSFCSAGNIRVWIDFNRNYSFEDAGETVMQLNDQGSMGPFETNFTVPNDAYLGTTRMRVTSKMQVSCGHILPSPCNNPVDPTGYHGEVEDYDIIIVDPTGLTNISNGIPGKFQLLQNYPNPFNPSTDIKFDIAAIAQVKLVVYDVMGREVANLVNENLQPGTYKIDWNASAMPSGVYYYKITARGTSSNSEVFTKTNKMVLVK